jgi:hypothetical protein
MLEVELAGDWIGGADRDPLNVAPEHMRSPDRLLLHVSADRCPSRVLLDHLGRSLRELLESVGQLKTRDVGLVLIEENVDSSSAAELVFTSLARSRIANGNLSPSGLATAWAAALLDAGLSPSDGVPGQERAIGALCSPRIYGRPGQPSPLSVNLRTDAAGGHHRCG